MNKTARHKPGLRRAPELERAAEDDRAWFQRHWGREHRLRKLIGRERAMMQGGGPAGTIAAMVIRRIGDGFYSLPCWLDYMPANSEQMAATIWSQAAADNPALRPLKAAIAAGGGI